MIGMINAFQFSSYIALQSVILTGTCLFQGLTFIRNDVEIINITNIKNIRQSCAFVSFAPSRQWSWPLVMTDFVNVRVTVLLSLHYCMQCERRSAWQDGRASSHENSSFF